MFGAYTAKPPGVNCAAGSDLPDDPRTAREKRQAYRDRRRLAYPKIEDQLDMIYHDTVDGTSTWVDAIAAVKQQHPSE